MKVITLSEDALSLHCRILQRKIEVSGFSPTLILGIASGGTYVAQRVCPEKDHRIVSRRRSFTKVKKEISLTFRILRILPLWVSDSLRIWEARYRERIFRKKGIQDMKRNCKEIELSPECRNDIEKASDILLVDDAVDTGETLCAVIESVKEINPTANIKSAVIAVTMHKPLQMPDFHIYSGGILVRFPWSFDYRNNR